jgi:hypothetical protein
MLRPFSRSSTDCGKVGADNTVRISSSAASRSVFDDSVRRLTLARSLSTLPPSRAPMSTSRPAIFSSSMSPAPASSRLRVSPARPDLAAGTKAPPPGEIDLHIEDGNHARLDKIHFGAGRRRPVFDPDARQGLMRDPKSGKDSATIIDQGTHQCLAPKDRFLRLALFDGLRIEHGDAQRVVLEVFLATACTSSAVTLFSFSSRRSMSRQESPVASVPPISMAWAISESRL